MISNALDDKALPVYGDGAQERDWLHTEDHCRAIFAVLEKGRAGEVYNIGGGHVEKNLTMVRRILDIIGKPHSLMTYVSDRPGHDRRYALNCSKIRTQLGWEPAVPLEDGLRATVDWYRNNSAWLASVRDGNYTSYYDKYYTNRDVSLNDMAIRS
jgi:dTDP-glucose 4,6-dehydratase